MRRKQRATGRTDSVDDEACDQKLSEHRAEAVINYLYAQGVSPSGVAAIGIGGTKPLADDTTKERSHAESRRVDDPTNVLRVHELMSQHCFLASEIGRRTETVRQLPRSSSAKRSPSSTCIRSFFAGFIGTFWLVLGGCGSTPYSRQLCPNWTSASPVFGWHSA